MFSTQLCAHLKLSEKQACCHLIVLSSYRVCD